MYVVWLEHEKKKRRVPLPCRQDDTGNRDTRARRLSPRAASDRKWRRLSPRPNGWSGAGRRHAPAAGLDHFDVIKILCILSGCFSQHAWMSSWEPGSMEIQATHEWNADVRIHTLLCRIALRHFIAAALQIGRLQDMSLRQHRSAVRKKKLACHDHVQFRRDLHSGSWLHLVF